MTLKGSYSGKILKVDLTSGKHKIEDLDPVFAKTYIGGRGFGAKILYDELVPGIDPLGPENILVFAPGALLGTAAPSASRATLSFKSPLSGLYGDAASMSSCGLNLKQAGYDCVIISGASSDPLYIFIDNDSIELRDATRLWTSNTVDTHKRIQTELRDRDISTACIGPAGENKVRYAAVMSDGQIGTHARCGGGAVFGSKNLKAVATRGHGDINIVDKNSFQNAFRDYLEVIRLDPYVAPAKKYGTPRFILHRAKYGIHGAENWRIGEYKWKTLHPDVFRDEYSVKAGSCLNCPVMCRREFLITHGKHAGIVAKMEWESIARSITCGIVDPEAIIYETHLANLFGIDIESLGDTVAFAFECYEKGLLTDDDTGGLKFNFGNAEALFEATRQIAYREGIGDLLAEGTKRAANKIGKGSQKFAMQVKGVEMTAADPRGMPVRAVSYATGTRGADHLRSNPYIEEFITPEEAKNWFGSEEASDLRKGVKGKGRLLKWSEDFVTIGDLLGICKFAFYRSATFEYLYKKGVELATRFYNACTGFDLTEEEMLMAGERTFNIEKAFNAREGADRKDDTIPDRFFEEPLMGGGPSGGMIVEKDKFDRILDEYYGARKWDVETGLQTEAGLDRLGLKWLADNLKKYKKLK